ncbi:MAG: hypothetical protein NC237_03655, partial [Eubacterium sp.]|nr:hypothetical protein [Eubacterium sp.]
MALSIYFLKGYGDGERCFSALSEERRRRAERAGSAAVRRDTIFSYLLLRLALSEEYGVLSAPEFFYGEYGKP